MTSAVQILLATYNGALFLPDQLRSIEEQTYGNIELIARDDCSEDNSKELLIKAKAKILPSEKRAGCVENFSRLLTSSTAPYLFFADQDDVWKSNKVSLCIEKMIEEEMRHPSNTPLLLHTDLEVVDASLHTIAPSFWAYSGIDPIRASSFSRLLVQNTVTGCAMMINRPLADLVGGIPRHAKMHDWWIALVAAAFGKIVSVPIPTLLYRQHASNSLGAKKSGLKGLAEQLKDKRMWEKLATGIEQRKKQAEAFFSLYETKLDDHKKKALDTVIQAKGRNQLQNISAALRQDILRSNGFSQLARFCLRNPF